MKRNSCGVTLIAFCLLMTLVIMPLGCDGPPLNTYRIDLVRPDGKTHESYIVKRVQSPMVRTEWGGQTYIRNDRSGRRTVSAPVGWYIKVTKQKEKKNE